MTPHARAAVAAAVLLSFLGIAPTPDAPARAGPDAPREQSSAFPGQAVEEYTLRGDRVALYNPAGDVEVTRGSGTDVRVTVRRSGQDADRLSVATGHRHGRQTLRVRHPSDEIVYPGGEGSTTLRIADDGTFGHDGGRRVRVRDHGSGLRVDTGSGSVEVSDVAGDLDVDTGSGSIRAVGVRGGGIVLDTGNGDVEGEDLTGDELDADTGSGDITLRRVSAPRLTLDTGSGSVRLGLLTDVDHLEIDTGSGSVDVAVPADFGSRVAVATGSGGVDLADLAASRLEVDDGDVSGVVGDGDGETVIDTGSGDVTIRRSGG